MTQPTTVANLLEHARRYPIGNPARHHTTRTVFGIHPARFELLLIKALDTREALEHDAQLTHQLIAERDRRLNARINRRTIR